MISIFRIIRFDSKGYFYNEELSYKRMYSMPNKFSKINLSMKIILEIE